ncbi:hypothetical protein ZWY2020_044454 [Hordeum vulgare]|nr:hypothetical protein ZWY2020_044454 [Hordeum vulgare]
MSSRTYDSSCKKRKKKQKKEAEAELLKGSLDRYVVKKAPLNSEIQTPNGNVGDHHGDDANTAVETEVGTLNEDEDANISDEGDNVNIGDEGDDVSTAVEGDDDTNNSFTPDIFDPRNWDALDAKMIDILLQKGPKRDWSIEHGDPDKFGRRFSALSCTRVLSNGEKCDREWLVYNKDLDKVFCFCCKLLRKGHVRGYLAHDGFNDWHHLLTRLKEHETSREHATNMATWYDLRIRFQNNQTIDKVAQRELEKEKEHWRKVLLRIMLIVKFLAERNIAFRGSNYKLYQESNGNFLGMVQMLAEFDPIMKEHVGRITNEKIRDHYLGPSIQNELISLLAAAIKSESIRKVKESKYFLVILDCTPDASHQEQMSLIIRYVDASSDLFCIEESFLGFLDVNDTTGQGLFDVLQKELKNLDLDVDNVRGQGYDNGSNMKGKK